MSINDATAALRDNRPQSPDERRACLQALQVLGRAGIDASVVEAGIGRRLTLHEEDVLYSSAAWRAA
jgi:hypothetical protein